ncbi:hypothetical protein DBIPINDM_008467 (plasmid) [Mesorhizobium sp. AR02]|uniref:hypothetical protein n=1 Tax=Mesorhizobium sp. AR02 TaxID=2865837 RepID=UPI002160B451|nr:hypothetical protein [Mesorhizobium sp. AR02]UVK57491.1 hypothetical protein DBIPINDM_008467 [Mesorhizobium sp. AR02]
MGGNKPWHDAIHDHQVECFAPENGLPADLVWELILKHGNSRKAVIKAAQGLKGRSAPYFPVAPTPPLTMSVGRRKQ